MPRLMSVALTEAAVVARTKTVTRRLGWQFLKPGDRLTLVRKAMGRKRPDGTVDPLVRLAEVEVVDVRREKLLDITDDDVEREGFPGWTAAAFVAFFVDSMDTHCSVPVTRIEWTYLDGDAIPDPPAKELSKP